MDSSTLTLYHTFLTAAQSPSLSAAAKALYISQPAVSKSIKKLEAQMGVELFVRSSKGIHLTGEGQIFYDYLHTAFETIAAGEDTLKRINDLGIGHIRIGVSSTLCKHILLPCLKKFLAAHPHIQVTIECQSTLPTVALLEHKEIDLGLIAQPEHNKKLCCLPAGTLNDIFAATPQYLAGLSAREGTPDLTRQADFLSHANLILLDKKNITRRYVDRYLSQWNMDAENAMEVNSMELLIDFVKTGLGAGCIIRQFIREELESGQLVELKTPESMRPRRICFAYNASAAPSPALQTLLQFIRQTVIPCL